MVQNPLAGQDSDVLVRVGADTSGFQDEIAAASDSIRSFKGLAGTAGAAVAALGIGGFAVATRSAAAFQEAMVGVEKVTSAETASSLNTELREMAETVPLAQSELAGIAEQAGRLGLEGAKNIQRFTRVTGEMVTATNLTADQAADAFARLTELTDISTGQVRELGSAINVLSNNMATSSSEIVDSMLRSSTALSSLGVQAQEQLALSAAINEVSESATRAGTRMRRLAQELQNPKRVEAFAEALGVTRQEFQQLVDESPTRVIRQLARTMSEGGEQADILRENLTSVSRQALGALSKNLQSVEQAQGRVNSEFQETGSLSSEFETAASTFNAELQKTRNAAQNVAIETGQRTLPAITDLIGGVRGAIQAFGNLNEATDGLAGSLGLATAAIGGTGLALAAFVSGPVGIAAAAVATLTAAIISDFADIRSSGDRLADDLGNSFGRLFDTLFEETSVGRARILPEFASLETGIAQFVDTVSIGLAVAADATVLSIEQMITALAAGADAVKQLSQGNVGAARETLQEAQTNISSQTEAFEQRIHDRGRRGDRRRSRRKSGLSATPQEPSGGSESERLSPSETNSGAALSSLNAAADEAATSSESFAESASSAASKMDETAQRMSTTDRRIQEAQRNAQRLKELGLEDRAAAQQDKAERLRSLSKSMARAAVKAQLESGKSPSEIFGGGATASGGEGGGAQKVADAVSGVEKSVSKVASGEGIGTAVASAIDGARLRLSGSLSLDGEVATMSDIEAAIESERRRQADRARDRGVTR